MRKPLILALYLGGSIGLASYQLANAQSAASGRDNRIDRGQQIAPVMLNLAGKDVDQVESLAISRPSTHI